MGEPVAVVVGRDQATARKALQAISIEYEALPQVFDPEAALAQGAPRLHQDGNLVSHWTIQQGDPEAGFAQAEVVLEETFRVPRVYPAYLEREACQAQWHEGGRITVWASTQKPFHDRHHIAQVLGIPEEAVQVIVPTVGGAFGGKEDSNLPILAALAAWKVGGAVRLVNSRLESLWAHPKRHAACLHYKIGARPDGTLVALRATVHLDTGAYASYGPAVGQLLAECAPGPYRTPNVRVDSFVVYTNGPIGGAMRGFGSPQANFACESMMDMLAARLGMDPIELRRKNIWRPGDRAATRVRVNQAEALAQALDLAQRERDRLRRRRPASGRRAGVGVALGVQTMGLGFRVPDDSTNRLEWLPEGKVRLYLGAPDLGQGLVTVAAQMTAEALGIPYDQIEVVGVDTARSPDGGVSCASRMTYMVGNSVHEAAEEMIAALLEQASRSLNVPREQLCYRRGVLERLDQPQIIEASEVVGRAAEDGVTIEGLGTFSFPYGPETPDHLPVGMPHVLFVFGAHVAYVEVDPEEGAVEVKELVAIHDVGKAINRAAVEGQIEGGAVMGLGYALSEEMVLKRDGRWVESFAEYLIPTVLDVPPAFKSVVLELPEGSGPHGVKGVGEMGLVPAAAAVANAVFDATRLRAKSLPLKPEILLAIRR